MNEERVNKRSMFASNNNRQKREKQCTLRNKERPTNLLRRTSQTEKEAQKLINLVNTKMFFLKEFDIE